MRTLKIRTDKRSLAGIIDGSISEERRYVLPSNADKYVIQGEDAADSGEEEPIVEPVPYDTITFVHGRGSGAQRATREVLSSKFVILTDENGEDLTFEDGGEEYFVCQVWYELGRLLSTENT